MVCGRTRKVNGRKRPVPAGQWIWSPEPTHPAIISRQAWDEAQKVGADRGNVRDAETPTARQGRHYVLRSRARHNACQRRNVRHRPAVQQRRGQHLLQVPARSDMHQVTIRASLTSDTPRTITALLTDPRTDGDISRIPAGQDPVYHQHPPL
jgi:hypothetical protein